MRFRGERLQPIVIIVSVVAGSLLGWRAWRTYNRRLHARMVPASFMITPDPAWSQTADGELRDRSLGLVSAVNLRDLGGYPTNDGKRIKWGLLYRSGTLSDLSPVDASALAATGIKTICDFRSTIEAEAAPDDAALFGAQHVPMPLDADHSSMRRLQIALFRPTRLRALLTESYRDIMIERNAGLIGRFLRLVADADNLPLLFHCTAGKDRTGIAAMILLSLLGVPDDVIAADYSISNAFYRNFREYVSRTVRKLGWIGVNVDDLHPLLVADPALIYDALEGIRGRYGSVETYAVERAGIDALTIAKLRDTLLEVSL